MLQYAYLPCILLSQVGFIVLMLSHKSSLSSVIHTLFIFRFFPINFGEVSSSAAYLFGTRGIWSSNSSSGANRLPISDENSGIVVFRLSFSKLNFVLH